MTCRPMAFFLLSAISPLLYAAAAPDFDKWQVAGDPQWVRRDGQRVTFSAEKPATAGLLSPSKSYPMGTTALLVGADVTSAQSRDVTFSAHSADGATTGYWQNAMPLASGRASAVLPATRPAGPLRVFVGTHARASSATIENVRVEPVRRGMSYRGTQYGSVVHGGGPEGQSFKSQGKRLAAIRVLARRMKIDDGPDLRVRVYPLGRDGAPDRAQPPLAETIVPRQQIPPASGRRDELTIPLAAQTLAGRPYFIEFTTTGPCEADAGFLLWAGIGTYADGCYYRNGTAVKDWDLHLETYEGL